MSKDIMDFAYSKMYSAYENTQINIFICGSSVDDVNSIRARLQDKFKANSKINIILPEWLFSSSQDNRDKTILEQEHLLAKNVDYIVIALESPGAICELGAFASIDELKSKIHVLVNKEHMVRKSFINQGPIKSISNINKKNVLIFDDSSLNGLIDNIYNAIVYSHIKRNHANLDNIFNLGRFIGYVIALYQPISTIDLKEKVKMWKQTLDESLIEPCLELLVKKGQIYLHKEKEKEICRLSPEGNDFYLFKPVHELNISKKVSSIRCKNLWKYYKNHSKLMVGGELKKLLDTRS